MEKEEEIKLNETSATEERNSAAFSDWSQKIRFNRSFLAKLILSEDKVKEFYAEIATELLKYERVKSKTGWSGVTFSAGRERLASIVISGKTLCLYLAFDPEELSEGRYKPKNVGEIKKRSKTPSMFKIKSEGAKRHAVALIGLLAKKENLKLKAHPDAPIYAYNFKTDTFNNLLTRGLIRVVRNSGRTNGFSDADESELNVNRSGVFSDGEKVYGGIYDDTVQTINDLFSRHGGYNKLTEILSEGTGKIRFSEKLMLRSIDEIWVKAVEDCINSLDELIRNPTRFIAETEEVLPIELTKRISGRSVSHLCRHTDYISPNEKGEITPTKMLNIFREDSLLTYENKFLNTLINRLYLFVSKRYKIAKENGVDEKLDSVEFEDNFIHGEAKGKIKISVELSEKDLNSDVKNTLFGSGLWARVERLNAIVTGYANSSFVKSMDKNFVRPPIMRTNAILKNKYFRECLALWEFIESYEDAGYGITVNETVKDVPEEYVKQMYAGAAMQYLIFKHNLKDDFGETEEYSSEVRPAYNIEKVMTEKKYSEEFFDEREQSTFDDEVEIALKVALLADEIMPDNELESETFVNRFVKTFPAKIRIAEDDLKENFVAIANEFFRYEKVKMRVSKRYATFNRGRKILARAAINGKSIKMYFALDKENLEPKYNVSDVSEKKAFLDTPVCLKVRSKRSVKYAVELVSKLCLSEGINLSAKEQRKVFAEDYAPETTEDMILKGWIIPTKTKAGANPFAKKEDTSGISYGPTKDRTTQIIAEEITKQAVTEQSILASELKTTESAATETANPYKQDIAKEIEEMVRPESDYSTPTKYGLDDTSGFMNDEKEIKKDK